MKKGDVIIVPTDTVYGLAARVYDDEALQRIYRIKGRDQSKKIPVLSFNRHEVSFYARISYHGGALMTRFWPGPLTLILHSSKEYLERTGNETIAIRIPDKPVLLDILKENGPLWVTSLNKSGEPPLFDEAEIKEKYGDIVDEIHFNDDTSSSNVSSTIVDMTKPDYPILRQGTITREQIDETIRLADHRESYNRQAQAKRKKTL
ncbi:MAG: L-threonylcarbamoyladenylate synthase [Acholeplasmataceae bacterium]